MKKNLQNGYTKTPSYDNFEYKSLFETSLMLTRTFGIDLSPYLKRTSKEVIEKIGLEKANALKISLTMDETFIFCYTWMVLKLFKDYPEDNCKLGQNFLMSSSIDFMTHYSFNALNDENTKKVFNAKFFMKLFRDRLDEYGEYFKLSEIVLVCYYLEIMNNTTEKLEYYDKEKCPFNVEKLKMFALDEVKWLDNEITELIKDFIIKNTSRL
jgi:hypothetical protein